MLDKINITTMTREQLENYTSDLLIKYGELELKYDQLAKAAADNTEFSYEDTNSLFAMFTIVIIVLVFCRKKVSKVLIYQAVASFDIAVTIATSEFTIRNWTAKTAIRLGALCLVPLVFQMLYVYGLKTEVKAHQAKIRRATASQRQTGTPIQSFEIASEPED
uniref:Uncharacterized protein n=1 Tax=Panagrolaimus davidi TaxID=227884 RepID=A0A914QB75_9BILA